MKTLTHPVTILASWRKLYASDFARKVAATFGTRLLLIAIGLVTGVIVTRTLGPEGRGLYATAVAVGAIGVQFGNLGLHASNTYYVAQDRNRLPVLLGNSLWVSLGLGGVAFALAWLCFTIWPGLAPVEGGLLVLALLWIPFGLATLLLQNLLLGIQAVRAYNSVELSAKFLAVVLIGLVIWQGVITPERIFLATFVALLVGLGLLSWQLGRRLPGPVTTSATLFRQGLHYGFKAYLAAFFSYLVLRADLIMVKQILGAEQTGYYAIAAGMADLVFMLPTVVGSLVFPRLTAQREPLAQFRLVLRITGLTALLLLIVVLIAGVLAEPAIRLLYGSDFTPAAAAFIWLLPGIFFLGIETVGVQYLNSIGLPVAVVIGWGASALLNILLNLWAIPVYGISGAAVVSSLSYMVMFLLIVLLTLQSNRRITLAR